MSENPSSSGREETPMLPSMGSDAAPKKKVTRKRATTAKKTTAKKATAKKAATKKTTRKKAATKTATTTSDATPAATNSPAPQPAPPVERTPTPAPAAVTRESSPPKSQAPAASNEPTGDAPKRVTRESIPRRGNRRRNESGDEPRNDGEQRQQRDGESNERGDRRGGRRNDRNERNERGDRNDRNRRGRGRRGRNNRRGRNDRNDRGDRNDQAPKDADFDNEFDDIDDDPNAVPGFRDRKRNRGQLKTENATACEGFLEISEKGFGFLRTRQSGFKPSTSDVFVLPDTVRHFGLRQGMMIEGEACDGPRGPQMSAIKFVNGRDPMAMKALSFFEELTAINPDRRFVLETTPDRFTTRVIDMMTPIGRGQRGLIVAPPRAGKTTLLQHIAEAISENYEDVHLMTLLVDERPEEVTALTRSLPKAEVFASSNDNDARNHMRVAEFAIERAKRLVEEGQDVFILLDSITRLGRAFNNSKRGKGRSMSGGVDIRALEIPRKLFAAARNTREAGSLTIIATALIETGSRADDLIFQEFKGTGNMELVLDRTIAQKYVYPAVDIFRSGTRREELLLPAHQLAKISLIRRGLSGHKPIEAIERLLTFLERFPSNAQMLMEIKAQGY